MYELLYRSAKLCLSRMRVPNLLVLSGVLLRLLLNSTFDTPSSLMFSMVGIAERVQAVRTREIEMSHLEGWPNSGKG